MKNLFWIIAISIPNIIFSQDLLFESQEEIDNFNGNSIIDNDVRISGDDITDLSSLENIKSISGELSIINNAQLVNFEGLENLESVGSLWIEGNITPNFIGLEGLKVIKGNCEIGANGIQFPRANPTIESLNGLENLRYIGGFLSISECENLTDISSIYNLDCVKEVIFISQCESLKVCALDTLCSLAKHVYLTNNSSECTAECGEDIDCVQPSITDFKLKKHNSLSIYPNPANDQICLITSNSSKIIQILIHDVSGIQISSFIGNADEISVNSLPQGVYIVSIITQNNHEYTKLVIE